MGACCRAGVGQAGLGCLWAGWTAPRVSPAELRPACFVLLIMVTETNCHPSLGVKDYSL